MRMNFIFLISFLLLFVVVSAQGKTISISVVPDKYNLVFNPFKDNTPLSAIEYKDVVYQWNPDVQSWADADSLQDGQGFILIPAKTSLSLKGGAFVPVIQVKKGYTLIGALSDKPQFLNDLVIVENGNKPLMYGGTPGFYNTIYKYDPNLGYMDLDYNEPLTPGNGYFIEATVPFTVTLKSTGPVEITCSSEADKGKQKCAVSEKDYKEPYNNQYATVSKEHDVLVCTKKSDGTFDLVPEPTKKCPVGQACRTSADGAVICKDALPPPVLDTTTKKPVWERT